MIFQDIKYCFFRFALRGLNIFLLFLFFFALVHTQNQRRSIKQTEDLYLQPLTLKPIEYKPVRLAEIVRTDSLITVKYFFTDEFETQKYSSFSFSAGYKFNSAAGKFLLFENNEPIIQFNDGDGRSFMFSIGFERQLSDNISIQANARYDNTFISTSTDYMIPIINNRLAKTNHTAELNLSSFGLGLLMKYRLFSDFRILGGFLYSFPISSKYDHIIKITSSELIYEGNITEKTFTDRSIKNILSPMELPFGLSWLTPNIIGNLGLDINLLYLHRLNSISDDFDLKISSFSINAGLVYLF